MKFDDLDIQDKEAIRLAMLYWVRHWDAECPVLFGISEEELTEVLRAWPGVAVGNERIAALAMIGSLRELIFGASSVEGGKVSSIIGITFEAAKILCSQVQEKLRYYL